jgi:hypothetical protein
MKLLDYKARKAGNPRVLTKNTHRGKVITAGRVIAFKDIGNQRASALQRLFGSQPNSAGSKGSSQLHCVLAG